MRNLLPSVRFLACAVVLSAITLAVSTGNGIASAGGRPSGNLMSSQA